MSTAYYDVIVNNIAYALSNFANGFPSENSAFAQNRPPPPPPGGSFRTINTNTKLWAVRFEMFLI